MRSSTCIKNFELRISNKNSDLLQLIVFMFWTVLNDPSNDHYLNKYKEVIGSMNQNILFWRTTSCCISLTQLFPMHSFATLMVFWCFRGFEKKSNGNKWVNLCLHFLSALNYLFNIYYVRNVEVNNYLWITVNR